MAAEKKSLKKRPTAEKRLDQNNKRRLLNKSFKSRVRTTIRRLEETLVADPQAASLNEALNNCYSVMDKGVKRGIFKANKASRTKARLAARVRRKLA